MKKKKEKKEIEKIKVIIFNFKNLKKLYFF
jgi:hypothetical protein